MTDLRTPPTTTTAPDRPRTRKARNRAIVAAALAAVVLLVVAIAFGRDTSMPATRTISSPSTTDLDSVAASRVFFGHQSVGDNILGGTSALYQEAGVEVARITPINGPVTDGPPFLGHTYVGANGDPASKIRAFSDLVRGGIGDQVDVAMMKLCYVDVDSTTDPKALFDQYSAAMDSLEKAYPGVEFVYTTVPLTTDRGWKAQIKALVGRDDRMGPADNVVRERYNALVRERYAGTGRLFDIAAVQSTNPDGSRAQRDSDGSTYYVLSADLAADAGHLNALGSKVAAAEFVRVTAAASRGQ